MEVSEIRDDIDFIACLGEYWPKGEFHSQQWSSRIAKKQFEADELQSIMDWLIDQCSLPPSLAKLEQAASESGVYGGRTRFRTSAFHLEPAGDCPHCEGLGLLRIYFAHRIIQPGAIVPTHYSDPSTVPPGYSEYPILILPANRTLEKPEFRRAATEGWKDRLFRCVCPQAVQQPKAVPKWCGSLPAEVADKEVA